MRGEWQRVAASSRQRPLSLAKHRKASHSALTTISYAARCDAWRVTPPTHSPTDPTASTSHVETTLYAVKTNKWHDDTSSLISFVYLHHFQPLNGDILAGAPVDSARRCRRPAVCCSTAARSQCHDDGGNTPCRRRPHTKRTGGTCWRECRTPDDQCTSVLPARASAAALSTQRNDSRALHIMLSVTERRALNLHKLFSAVIWTER